MPETKKQLFKYEVTHINSGRVQVRQARFSSKEDLYRALDTWNRATPREWVYTTHGKSVPPRGKVEDDRLIEKQEPEQ